MRKFRQVILGVWLGLWEGFGVWGMVGYRQRIDTGSQAGWGGWNRDLDSAGVVWRVGTKKPLLVRQGLEE